MDAVERLLVEGAEDQPERLLGATGLALVHRERLDLHQRVGAGLGQFDQRDLVPGQAQALERGLRLLEAARDMDLLPVIAFVDRVTRHDKGPDPMGQIAVRF